MWKRTWLQLHLEWLSDSTIDLIKKETDSGGRNFLSDQAQKPENKHSDDEGTSSPSTSQKAPCHAPTNDPGVQPLTTLPERKSVIDIIFHELSCKGEINDTVQ